MMRFALAVLCLAGLPKAAEAQAAFDGTWQISRTGVGCTPTGTIQVQAKGGRISGSYTGGTGLHTVSGRVSKDGGFSFTAKSPSDLVRFQGRVSGQQGSGQWSVDGRNCGGTLTVSR